MALPNPNDRWRQEDPFEQAVIEHLDGIRTIARWILLVLLAGVFSFAAILVNFLQVGGP